MHHRSCSQCKGSGKPRRPRDGETATAAAGAAAGAGAEAVVAVTTTPPSRCAVEPAIGCHSCCAAMQGRRARRDTSTCMKAGGYTLEKRKCCI